MYNKIRVYPRSLLNPLDEILLFIRGFQEDRGRTPFLIHSEGLERREGT